MIQSARQTVGVRAWRQAAYHIGNGQRRALFAATLPLLEKKTVNVPTMGDSITEGTIVEWTAAVGQAVKEGDVVAMVETDKVTVDIKAEMDGVIVQQFGALDDTIEVGAKLYEIDTEAEGTIVPTSENGATETKPQLIADVESVVATESASPPSHSRNPLIHFLGKDGWAKRLAGHGEETATNAPLSPTAVVSVQVDIHPMYGRPAFSEREMEALILGGAELAPTVVFPSGGARFAVRVIE